jgi:glucokinase
MPEPVTNTRLVADIGGTNSRLALYDPDTGKLSSVCYYTNLEFQHFHQVIEKWLDTLASPAPRVACLAIAAPLSGDHVSMINMNWSFSISELARQFNFKPLACINDFEANAYALPHLGQQELVSLTAGQTQQNATLATIGPGTGLGGATLIRNTPSQYACAAEPGHMGLSPGNALEMELFRVLLSQHRDVYAELLVSGPGMARLYAATAIVRGESAQDLAPAEISARALTAQCPICVSTVATFCALLGSVCGDFVLANGAYGGLYLAGGIVPSILPILEESSFSRRFQEKGEMEPILAKVPRLAITSTTTGLLGAGHVQMVT